MMMIHTLLDRIKLMLGINDNDRDALITEIIRLSAMPVLLHIKQDSLPGELEWIVVEFIFLAMLCGMQIGAEGLSQEQSDNIRNTYEGNVLDKYIQHLDAWVEANTEATEAPKVRFF